MKKRARPDKLHYTGCGLDYIYLLNGFDLYEDEDGDVSYVIQDAAQLHEAIAYSVVTEMPELRGMELRFLRSFLHFSQEAMAKLLYLTRDSIAKSEAKPKKEIPQQTEALLRLLVVEEVKGNTALSKALKILRDSEDFQESEILLEKKNNHWASKAA